MLVPARLRRFVARRWPPCSLEVQVQLRLYDSQLCRCAAPWPRTKAPIAPVSENSRQMGGAVWTCAGIRPEASRIRIRVVHVIQEVCWKQANLGDTRRLLVRPLLSQQQPGCHLSLHDHLQNAASCSIQLALQRPWSLNGFAMRFPSVDFPRH